MRKRILSEFGIQIRSKLDIKGMNQNDLIDLVCEKTGMFFDSGYLYKIMTGQRTPPKIIQAICEILDIPEQQIQDDSTESNVR